MKQSMILGLFLLVLFLSACQAQEPETIASPEQPIATAEAGENTAANSASENETDPVEDSPETMEDSAVEPTAESVNIEAEMPETADLTAQPWQWVSFTSPVEQFDVETPDRYRVLFHTDGTVQIVADCNNASGEYTENAGALTITVGPSTLAACPPDSLSNQFITYLSGAARTFFEDGTLYIDLFADGGTMVLAPSDNSNMVAEGEGDLAGGLAVPGIEPLETCFAEPPADLSFEFDVTLDCGYVIVPEFYNQPGDKTFKIGFMRLNARQETDSAPLFILGGGPGQDMVSGNMLVNFSPQMLGGVLDTRDVVFLNQRGVKHTEPVLDCPAFHALQWTAVEQQSSYLSLLGDTLQSCVDELEAQGVNFDAFNSVEIAADVNSARQALGYDRIIYYGASYGSQLGQHVMRDFPEILEGVVLDGANSLSRRSWMEDRALDAQWGLDNLTALCEADDACRQTYDIQTLVEEKFALMGDAPLTYTYVDPDDPTITFDVTVTKADLARLIYTQFGKASSAVGIPYLLTVFAADVDTLTEALGYESGKTAVASRGVTEGNLATLMHYAVVCSDDPVASIEDLIVDDTVGEYARQNGEVTAQEYVIACDVLNVQLLPDATDENVTAAIPTLILAGSLDVNTPAYRSQIVADALPNDTFVVFPGRTHVQIDGANECAGQIMTQFVLDPTATLDLSCADESSPYPFLLPDGSSSGQN